MSGDEADSQAMGSEAESGELDMEGESDQEEAKRAMREHADYLRLHKKPLQFGMEELLTYSGHTGEVKDFI